MSTSVNFEDISRSFSVMVPHSKVNITLGTFFFIVVQTVKTYELLNAPHAIVLWRKNIINICMIDKS